MELRSTLETPATPPVVVEVPPNVETLEQANAAFEAAFGGTASATPAGPSTAPTTQALTTTDAAPPAPRESVFADDLEGVLMGDFDSSDMTIPNLRIVAGSGALAEKFQVGSLIFADEVVLDAPDPRKPDPSKVLQWAPLTLKKSFREVLSKEEREAGVRPRFAASAAEVQSMGGTTQWIGNTKPNWEPSAAVMVLLRKPSWVDHPGFGIDIGEVDKDGKPVLYAIGVYYAASTAYRKTVKLIVAQAASTLKVPVRDAEGKPTVDPVTKRPNMSVMLHKYWWTFSVAKEKIGEYTVPVPVVRMTTEQTSEALRNYLADFISSQTV